MNSLSIGPLADLLRSQGFEVAANGGLDAPLRARHDRPRDPPEE